MGIFNVKKKNLAGEIVEEYTMHNIVLDAGLEYLCNAVGNDLNKAPSIGVGTSDITPDTNQVDLISPVATATGTYTAGTATSGNPQGNKQFTVTAHFTASQAIGQLSELAYYMNTGAPLNRTLFQTPGSLDTRFANSPELDQFQITDVTNLFQVYGANYFDQTFKPGQANILEVALSLASSGNPAYPLQIQICDDNAGVPGTVVATTTIAPFAQPVQEWRIASFGNPVALTAGNTYHLVVSSASTDLANCYDLFGSATDVYSNGQLFASTDSGTSWALPASASLDMGFKTYYSTSGAAAHDYVVTLVNYETETGASTDYSVSYFPENNLDSTNTSQGTVRLTLPNSAYLPPYTSGMKVYKKTNGVYGLLATLQTARPYFYDNGLTLPASGVNPPAPVTPVTPTGLATQVDTTNGGNLPTSINRYYKVSALQQGPVITTESVGPFTDNSGVNPPGTNFYDNAYNTQPVPMQATYYETAASAEIELVAPTSVTAAWHDFFSGPNIDTSKWIISNNNPDYFSFSTNSFGESTLQLQGPAGTAFGLSSVTQVRPGQVYYFNFYTPWLESKNVPKPTYSNGVVSYPPEMTDSKANRIPVFSFQNPNNITSFNNDKRLTLEFGFYHQYRTEAMWDAYDSQQPNWDQYGRGPLWCLYDNVGNQYFFNASDIPSTHPDKSVTIQVRILSDGTMQLYYLNTNRSFVAVQSTHPDGASYNIYTQFNGSHENAQTIGDGGVHGAGKPGPQRQTTNHFKVASNNHFTIGNPTRDGLAFIPLGTFFSAVNDSLYTVPGVLPAVPVPAIAMTQSGYQAVATWDSVPAARKYNVYSTTTSGDYSVNGGLAFTYDTYFPAYNVQSTETAFGNDMYNGIVAAGNQVRNWLDFGVTYGIDTYVAMTSETNQKVYALGGFVGSTAATYGNPLVPTIVNTPGSAEGSVLELNQVGQASIFTFMGAGLEIVGETGPNRGIMSIWIDGNFTEDVDCYSPSLKEQVQLFVTNTLTPGFHTIIVRIKSLNGVAQQNDFATDFKIHLDYYHITLPAFVDNGTFTPNVLPKAAGDSNLAPITAPSILGSRTYNGNAPTVVTKDPQHTLDVTMTFSLVNPNL